MAAREMINEELWKDLHRDPRHNLRYPSEHVVRWVAGLGDGKGKKATDIGCGSGRHFKLFTDRGFELFPFDTSFPVLSGQQAGYGDMKALPCRDEVFDVALSFGVFYYGTVFDHHKAVDEMHRVLKPGGHAFVVIRTPRDSRAAGPYESAERTMVEGDEAGMLINFLSLHDIGRIYGQFRDITIDTSETTRDGGKWLDSDWLIRLTK